MSATSSADILPKSELFHRYYDALFTNKDYAAEVASLKRLHSQWGAGLAGPILEIGCGTGSHTMEIAKWGRPMTAIDIDSDMVAKTAQKLRDGAIDNVTLRHCPVEQLDQHDFSLATAMFNVVTYLGDGAALSSFLGAIAKRLSSGGILIFDCWNGVAALRSPPGSKESSVMVGEKSISCSLTSTTDLFAQKTRLTYEIEVRDRTGELLESGKHAFMQTLWTPMQIMDAMQLAGLETCAATPLHDQSRHAGHDDWKIMFVGRKN